LFVLVLLSGALVSQVVLEAWGARVLFLLGIFGGVLPILAGGVTGLVSNAALTPAVWLVGVSPASAPFYAPVTLLKTGGFPDELSRAVPNAFWFWQGITVIAAVWLVVKLRGFHKARRASVLGLPSPGQALEAGK
jgi:hypothetical protein